MKAQVRLGAIVAAIALVWTSAASAQQSIGPSDIQRLQDQLFAASTEVSQLRSRNASLGSALESELDSLREEVIYLKVKVRKEGNVNWNEYAELRDKLQDLRSRARGAGSSSATTPGGGATTSGSTGYGSDATTGRTGRSGTRSGSSPSGGISGGVVESPDARSGTSQSRSNDPSVIPVDQEIDVRLERELSSETAQVEDRFEAVTVADLYRGNEVLIPSGSRLRGVVSSVDRATRTDRKGALTVAFDQITIRGRNYPMRGTVTEALESEGIRGEAARIGAGAGVGAIIGGILGGVKGALLGVLIGGGGTIAATEGQDVHLPPGTILRVRLDDPPDIR